MNKSNVPFVIFAISFMTVNGHTYRLFKSIFNDVHTEGEGEINTVTHNHSKRDILILY